MIKKIVVVSWLSLLTLCLYTCTKRNDFLSQYATKIENINPSEGYPGEAIEIIGKGFSSNSDLVHYFVKLNGVSELIPATAIDGKLAFEVPAKAQSGILKVYTYYNNILLDSAQSTQRFIINNNYTLAPIITGFTPNQGHIGTVISIKGRNFSTYNNGDIPQVIINKQKALHILDFTDTSIMVEVDTSLSLGKYMLSVKKKNMLQEGHFLEGNAKDMFEVVASSLLRLDTNNATIGDSIHIKGTGLLNTKNVVLRIGNTPILSPFRIIHDSLLEVKITNDVYDYISPKDNAVFDVSVLYNNQQDISAGSLRIGTVSNTISFVNNSVTIKDRTQVKYNKISIKSATLYLKSNNTIIAQQTINDNLNPLTSPLSFNTTILQHILEANEDSKIVQGEIKILNNKNETTTYNLGNLTVNAVATYMMPNISSPLKAKDVIVITGSHIEADANKYELSGFLQGKKLLATNATSTSITFTIPNDIAGGDYTDIQFLVNGNNTNNTIATVPIIPTITGISPTSGSDSTILHITGYNLYPKIKIYFDTINVNKIDTVIAPFQNYADTIASKKLAGNMAYTVGIGNETSNSPMVIASQSFTYTISNLSVYTTNANKALIKAQDSIKIAGKGIQSSNNVIVKYNGISVRLHTTKMKDTLVTDSLTSKDINNLNIADNISSIPLQVYIEQNTGIQLLVGTITLKLNPIISNINPVDVVGNDIIIIDGKHLSNIASNYLLHIGNKEIPLTSATATTLKFKIPTDIAAGSHDIDLKLNNEEIYKTTTQPIKISPTITKISPTNGTSGTVITIEGYNFGETNTITIGTKPATINSSSSDFKMLTCTMPADLNGGTAYPIELIAGGITITSSVTFTYNLSGLKIFTNNKNTNLLEPNNTIQVLGNGLKTATGVLLKNGTSSIINTIALTKDNTEIETEKIDISMINALGIKDNEVSIIAEVYILIGSTQTLAGTVTVKPTPQIIGINSTTATGNDIIILTGKHLSNVTGISINGTSITPNSATSTTIKFIVPTNIAAGSYNIDVKLNGTTTINTTQTLEILPTITKFTPTSGTSGTVVNIEGYNFSTSNNITIGNTTLTSSSTDFKTLSFKIPADLTGGTAYPITLKTDNGKSTTSNNTFTYLPMGTSVTTNNGNILEATGSINISGNGLDHVTSILLKNGTATQTINSIIIANNTVTVNNISASVINGLGIADNQESAIAQVYVLVGSAQTLVGTITIRPQAEIININSTTATGNDIITLTGKHLNNIAGNYNISIGSSTSINPTSATSTTIKFIVPTNIAAGSYNIDVKLNGTTINTTQTLEILPTITKFTPTSGTLGTVVNIEGYNFSTSNDITIGNTTLTSSSTDFKTLSFKIPAGLTGGTAYPITLKTDNGKSTTSNNTFTYLPMGSIKSSSATNANILSKGDYIQINGDGLSDANNIVLKYGNNTQIIGIGTTKNNTVLTSIQIDEIILKGLNIPISKQQDVVQVYIQTNTTETLIGTITIQAIPIITSMNVASTDILQGNDIITFSGGHLSNNWGDYQISIGGQTVAVNAISGSTTLKIKIPTNIPAGTGLRIDVLINGVSMALPVSTINIIPTITSITPSSIILGNNFSIVGNNLPSLPFDLYLGTENVTNTTFSNITSTPNIISGEYTISKSGTYPLTIQVNGLLSNAKTVILK